jgi:hypothetical protein
VKRTRYVAARTALVTTAIAVCLAGCSALSPAVIATPYPASDGIDLNLPGTEVGLRNLLVVGTAKDASAAVLGSVVNDGATAVKISLQADPGTSGQPVQTLIEVPAHTRLAIGPNEVTTMVITALPVAPGADIEMSIATTTGGRTDAQVPVVLAQAQYASLTPAPAPTDTPLPTGTATPLSSDAANATPTDAATSTPKATKKTAKKTAKKTTKKTTTKKKKKATT